MWPKQLEKYFFQIEKKLRDADIIAGKSGRHMKFPYTISAKIAQFPMFYYFRKNWIWMYYPFGWVVGLYLISYIHAAVNSDANVRSWAESQAKIAEKEAHH